MSLLAVLPKLRVGLLWGPVGAVLLVAVALLAGPKEHMAQAQLLMGLGSPASVGLPHQTQAEQLRLLSIQLAVLRSDALAQNVATSMALHADPIVRQQFGAESRAAGGLQAWATQVLPRRLSVRQQAGSQLVNIEVRAQQPELAEALVKAASETLLELLAALQHKVAAYDLAAHEESLDLAASQLSRSQRSLAVLHTAEGLPTSLNLELQATRDPSLAMVVVASTSTLAAKAQSRAVLDLAQAQARLQAAKQRWGEAHPQFQALHHSADTAAEHVHLQARDWLYADQVEDAWTRQFEQVTELAMLQQRQQLADAASPMQAAHPLRREALQATRLHQQRHDRVLLASLAANAPLTSALLLSPARASASEPKLWPALVLGLLLGACASVSLALLRGLLYPRLRSGKQAGSELELPVLGVMAAPSVGLRTAQARQATRVLKLFLKSPSLRRPGNLWRPA